MLGSKIVVFFLIISSVVYSANNVFSLDQSDESSDFKSELNFSSIPIPIFSDISAAHVNDLISIFAMTYILDPKVLPIIIDCRNSSQCSI